MESLPAVFAVTDLAAASVSAAATAVPELVGVRRATPPLAHVDRRLASMWFASSLRLDRLAKEGPSTRRIAVLAKEHVHDCTFLINRAIQTVLLVLAENAKNGAMRSIDATLSQELDDLPAGQRVGQVPAHGGQDHVSGPVVTIEG